ncbi:hypothetical protein [Sphingomonas carotinifaciens]|uniref:Lipoprotein n=1 Tax=Sphingomonas carotinifaciens TaxID=1166323 RepID=A0A1G7Q219_9SPHN|nr:hypothetical protein [Sphingomonas carotinifaciens]MBB4087603.1 hypothetical protein [Sphingomonas carotinifaciens]MWC45688.1 hypothetical protein [Sphingomonas carotinifaciens]SDF92627.1 hypothetical protein SAMN05216557_107175 [Sphingomonas carotinifaciens]
MKKIVPLCALLAVCGCQQKVAVPNAQQLVADRALLTEWQRKCDTGEYSQLAATEKADLCATTQEATISVAQIQAGMKDSDFFKANSLRK